LPDNTLHDEKELLLRASDGDEIAFGVLFNKYYPEIYSVVHRFSLHDHEVHEALQETFIKVWLQRDQLENVANFKAWLLRIASRQCRDMLRKNLLIQRTSAKFQENLSSEIDDTSVKVSVNEVKRLVEEAVDLMPAQRKRIYELSRKEELTPTEISQRLSLSVSTVKNTLTAALIHIREYLSAAGYSLPIFFFVLFF
jgi:RNA polymerase sigma-70 factor (family 1)